MKAKHLHIVFLVLFISLLFAGCKEEYKTKTVINKDGSCVRTVKLYSDQKKVDFNTIKFPVPYTENNGWKLNYEKDKNDTSLYVYTAEKTFSTVEDMNKEYTDKGKTGIQINFNKKFRWFYTFFEYDETYLKYFPFNHLELKNFLTQEEFKRYNEGDSSKVLKDKLDEFMTQNIIQEFWVNLKDSLKIKSVNGFNYEKLLEKKGEIEKWVKDLSDKPKKDDEGIKSLSNILKTKDVKDVHSLISKIVDSIFKKFAFFSPGDDNFTNSVALPGIIISSNSTSIKGNEAEWKFKYKRFCFEDYKMQVESRVMNEWAFVLTGIIVLMLILLLIMPKFRKRNVV